MTERCTECRKPSSQLANYGRSAKLCAVCEAQMLAAIGYQRPTDAWLADHPQPAADRQETQ